MYPDERVVRLVTAEFLPSRVHVHDPDGLYARVSERLNVHWTPTVLILDSDGVELKAPFRLTTFLRSSN